MIWGFESEMCDLSVNILLHMSSGRQICIQAHSYFLQEVSIHRLIGRVAAHVRIEPSPQWASLSALSVDVGTQINGWPVISCMTL